MKTKGIQILVALIIFSAAGIVLTQVYWVRKAYKLQEVNFSTAVTLALRTIQSATEPAAADPLSAHPWSAIRRDEQRYSFAVRTPLAMDELQLLLIRELQHQNVLTDFEFAMYCSPDNRLAYQSAYSMQTGKISRVNAKFLQQLPGSSAGPCQVVLDFPQHPRFFLSRLTPMVVTSICLAGVLLLLGNVLSIILKQRRLTEVQREFVKNMSHEFKTPLSSIQLSADVFKDPNIANNPKRMATYAAIISNEANRLSTQVDYILKVTHTAEQRLRLDRAIFDWHEALNKLKEEFSVQLGCEGKITLHLPDKPMKYFGDEAQIRHSIGHLLDNAIKYNQNVPDIHVFLRNGSNVAVSVQDNGIGISRHEKLLFEAFYRVPTGDRHDVKGLGLGLSYVKMVTKAHGGDVKFSSQLGKGSIFTITYPLKSQQ